MKKLYIYIVIVIFSILIVGLAFGFILQYRNNEEYYNKLTEKTWKNMIFCFGVKTEKHLAFPEEISNFKIFISKNFTTNIAFSNKDFAMFKVLIVFDDNNSFFVNFDKKHWCIRDHANNRLTTWMKVMPGALDIFNYNRFTYFTRLSEPEEKFSLPTKKLSEKNLEKLAKYFSDLSDNTPINKKRLAIFFTKLNILDIKFSPFRNEQYTTNVCDYLLKKHDDLTYNDFLKITGLNPYAISEAPESSLIGTTK